MNQIAPNFKAYLKKIDDQLAKSFWLCSSSAVSVAIVLSGSPAWAEGKLSVSHTSSPDVFSSTAFASETAAPETAAPETAVPETAASETAAPETAALEEANYSAEALTQPVRPSNEAAIEPLEAVLPSPSLPPPSPSPSPIAQADTPNLEPAPSGELQPSESSPEPSLEPSSEQPSETPLEPSSEPSSEPFPETQPSEPSPASPSPASASNQNWQFSVEPYFYAPLDVNTDVTVNGRSTSINFGLSDFLNFDSAFTAGLRLRAQSDRLGFLLDGFYLYAENSGSLGRTFSSGSIFQFVQRNSPGTLEEFVQRFEPQQIQRFVQIGRQIGLNTPVNVTADGTVSVRQITIDAAVSYRVVDTSLDRSDEGTNFYPRLAVAPIAGVRTNILRQTIEVDDIRINGRTIPDRVLPPIDRNFRFTRTLVEPLIGAQIDLALSEQWALAFRGDVSGFNIGARQNFTWNVMFGAQYNISRNVALQLAYRFNGFDFETGEGLRRTELNLRQNGVMLNAIFRF